MPRFYVNISLAPAQNINLPETVVRHIHVLRLREGDQITLFCGDGYEYQAILSAVGKRSVQVDIEAMQAVSRESSLWIGLAQSLSSSERMEFTLQKGVEMGVNVFQPITTERSAIRFSQDKAIRRLQRWQDIVMTACEQCGRNVIPEVRTIMSWAQWLDQPIQTDTKLILSLRNRVSLSRLPVASSLWLMAGPEGGFSEAEELQAQQKGWQSLNLGPRILRTETAALSAVAALQTSWGDYGE